MIFIQVMIDLLVHLLVKEMINYLVVIEILDQLMKMHIFQDGVDLIQKMVYHLDSLQQVDINNLSNKYVKRFLF